ncbi:MAG: hypothetical protein LBV61_10650 [Burkholderiaceae bacterium]|jgi:hypothetical protein|nr:hypothetical protein [Burkholderiaceae bacterium]
MKRIAAFVLASLALCAHAQQAPNSRFLNLPREAALQAQLKQCNAPPATDGKPRSDACVHETRGAYAYLMNLAKGAPLPDVMWMQCAVYYKQSYPTMARCMAAQQDLCTMTPEGELADTEGCMRIMQSGIWTDHPKATGLKF